MSDSQIRKQAIDTEKSFIISAPAGSGKTSLLVQRYINLLCKVAKPENIIAVTFTRKAAAEMQSRVQEVIDLASDNSALEGYMLDNQKLAKKLLAHANTLGWQLGPQNMRILTIDSLNNWITQSAPLASGLGAEQELCANSESDYQLAIRNFIYSEKDPESAAAFSNILSNINNEYNKLASLLLNMLQTREQWLRHIFHTSPDKMRSKLEFALQDYCEQTINEFKAVFTFQLRTQITPLLRYATLNHNSESKFELPVLDENLDLPEPSTDNIHIYQNIYAIFFKADGTIRETLNKNNGFPTETEDFNKAQCKQKKTAMINIIAQQSEQKCFITAFSKLITLPSAEYSDQQWSVLKSLITVLPEVVAHLKIVFEHKNRVDYTEKSLSAIYTLEQNHMELSAQLDAEIKHILIDEFQDTSLAQHRLIKALTDNWQQGDGRTLFCVGDPMQSIYRFRQAKVDLFLEATKNGMGKIQLTHLTLTQNFRSDPLLIEWVNNHMQHAFAHDSSKIVFNPAVSTKQPSSLTEASFNILESDDDEAREILETINSIRSVDKTGSIAIIVRARTHLSKIIPTLKESGIEINAQGLTPVAKQKNISCLHSITSILLNISDEIAWATLLRSPIIACSLRDLQELKANSSLDKLLIKIPTTINKNTHSRIATLTSVLNNALLSMTARPFIEVIQSTWNILSGNPERQLPTDPAQEYFDNLKAWLEISETKDPTEFATIIQRKFINNNSDDCNAINIMTIHHAKGLEFEHVIMPGLARFGSSSGHQLLYWAEKNNHSGEPQLLLAPLSLTMSDDNTIYELLRKQESSEEVAEATRVLYVALTRARTSLHLFATLKISAKNNNWSNPRSGTLLEKIWKIIIKNDPADANTATIEENIAHDFKLNLWNSDIIASAPSKYAAAKEENTIASQVGTIAHKILQNFDLATYNKNNTEKLCIKIQTLCRSAGFSEQQTKVACSKILHIVDNIATCKHGRWIFEPGHQNIAAEMKICRKNTLGLETYIIDRTFISNGVRWIIDFKTTESAQSAELSQFIDEQKELYGQQLANYATLFADEGLKTMVALYFPGNESDRRWIFWQEPTSGEDAWNKQKKTKEHLAVS